MVLVSTNIVECCAARWFCKFGFHLFLVQDIRQDGKGKFHYYY